MSDGEARARLARLHRLSLAALSAQGFVLRAGAIGQSSGSGGALTSASDADAAVEGAAVRAAALALIAAVEGLLDLCAEVKLDASLALLSAPQLPPPPHEG